VTGTQALGTVENGLLGIGAVAIILAAMMFLRPLAPIAREGLRVVPLAAPALVVLQMVDQPGSVAMELRWGVFTALAAGLLMASAAWHGSTLRAPKRVKAVTSAAPAAAPIPAPAPLPGSVAPPGL
jgi:hypothetical protein